MANYGNELLEDFMKAWIGSTPETDGEDGFDPADVELKAAWLDFEHAGRYSLKFRNQGFDVSGFGKTSTDEETGKKTCLFWKYVTSPDANYYDAEFETRSRPAYDAALYLEAFSDSDAFCSLSTATFTFISSSLSGCSMRNLVIASQALLTASRRNISLSEYSQRLMTGIIFWASIDTEPFCFLIAIVYIPLIASEFGAFLLRKRILAPRPSICKKKLALSP